MKKTNRSLKTRFSSLRFFRSMPARKTDDWLDWTPWKSLDEFSGITWRIQFKSNVLGEKIKIRYEIVNNYSQHVRFKYLVTTNKEKRAIFPVFLSPGESFVSEQYENVDESTATYHLIYDDLTFDNNNISSGLEHYA